MLTSPSLLMIGHLRVHCERPDLAGACLCHRLPLMPSVPPNERYAVPYASEHSVPPCGCVLNVTDAVLPQRALNTAIGGNANSVYLIVGSIGTPTGEGLDFINGYAWLERFYTAYSAMTNQLGVATTKYTNSTDN